MTTELTVLVLAALVQVVQFVAYSVAANLQVGPAAALAPRDEAIRLTGTAGRLQRALVNHFEGLLLFTIAVLAIPLSDQSSAGTRASAWIYLAARILYVPAYAFGLVPWRSVIWAAGFLATLFMRFAALI